MFYEYLVEFLGSILLVYVIFATKNPLAIGFSYAFILLLTQKLSNGFMNPAVTLVMASTDNMAIADLFPYLIAQILGGFIGFQIFAKYGVASFP
jgi:glycerol uptake facilitator-like aquaporin